MFKLLRGRHCQVVSNPKSAGQTGRAVFGKDKNKPIGHNKTYAALMSRRDENTNEIKHVPQEGFTEDDQYVTSNLDLVAQFGSEKFQKVDSQPVQAS